MKSPSAMRRAPVWLMTLLTLGLLAGCDQTRIAKLQEGVSTEVEVRAQFGEPAATYVEDNGSRTLEYPRQPEGTTNYMITIGVDGTMVSLRQVLNPKTFAQVSPGLDQAAVRRLLGRPAKIQHYELKNEDVWDWHWMDGQAPKLFSVTFDDAGHVTGTAIMDDPRHSHG